MTTLPIVVRKTHIEKGVCKSPQRCAIAAAIREEYPNVTYVAVRTSGITVTHREPRGEGYRWHYAVPLKAAKAIIAFDNGEVVKPFSFNAKLIDEIPLKSRTVAQQEQDQIKQATKRARYKAEGRTYKPLSRIAGV